MVRTQYKRILTPPKGSFFLFGMRGCGKSSWVLQSKLADLSINLLREDLYQRILANPMVFSGLLENLKNGSCVFVDEIQRIPSLLNEVHRFIEEKKMNFILTGSSARKLKSSGVNLLGGRALVKNLLPLLPEEMGKDFHLAKALQFGTLALTVTSEEPPKERLRAYVQTYLKEEIQAEALVRNLPGFARFLPIAALFHGQVINVSNIARECGVERTTVAGYLDILEDTLLTFRLPAFEAKLRVRERKHPKLYWIDSGVARAAKGQLGEVSSEERGVLLEGFVAQTLRAYKLYHDAFDDMYYWSSTQAKQTEVDFLIRRDHDLLAIEVKAANKIHEDSFKGLRAIAPLKGVIKRILIYLGPDRLKTQDGIHVFPVLEFVRLLEKDKLFS